MDLHDYYRHQKDPVVKNIEFVNETDHANSLKITYADVNKSAEYIAVSSFASAIVSLVSASADGLALSYASGNQANSASTSSYHFLGIDNSSTPVLKWYSLPSNAFADHTYGQTASYSAGLQLSTGTNLASLYAPVMTTTQLGVAKVNTSSTSAVTVTNGTTKYYGVGIDSNNKLYVGLDYCTTSAFGLVKVTTGNGLGLSSGVLSMAAMTAPTASAAGTGGAVPAPAAGQQDYILSASGWVIKPTSNTDYTTLQAQTNSSATAVEHRASSASGSGITITGGTNKFTITSGGVSTDINITPSITNNVLGSGLTANTIILGNGNSGIKTSSKYIATAIDTTAGTASTTQHNYSDTYLPTNKAVVDYVNTATAGLTGAMHLIGTVTAGTATTDQTAITLDGTATVLNKKGYTPASGDVVLYGDKEYVYDGTNWKLLGDEGSYALKTYTVTGANGLTGGGALSTNPTISHATNSATVTAAAADASATTLAHSECFTALTSITLDDYGHPSAYTYTKYKLPSSGNSWRNVYVDGTEKLTTATTTKAINYKAGTDISLTWQAAGTSTGQSGSANYSNLIVNHAAVTCTTTAAAAANSGTALSHSGEFVVPTALTVSDQGHVTALTWTRYKLPSDNNTATAADNILDGSNSGTQITYAPYTAQQAKLSFDTSTTNPTRTDRLNLNGYLYATKLYSGGTEVLTAHQTIYGLAIQDSTTAKGTYTPNSAAATLNFGSNLAVTLSGSTYTINATNTTYTNVDTAVKKTEVTQALGTSWQTTGTSPATNNTLTEGGTYAVQVYGATSGQYIASGVMSWSASGEDEIALHQLGSQTTRIYLKVSAGKFYLASSAAIASQKWTIAYRRIL